jgi:lauroyl/myristoyl acyltransferase
VPPTPLVKARKADFLGGAALFPRGAVRLATAHSVPLVIFRSTVDPVSGKREIWIESPATDTDETILFERAVRNLEEAVKMQPAAWHLWGALGAFSEAPAEPGHPLRQGATHS